MRATRSVVISMRLPAESGKRLKRMANRHGWTPSDASARLVEEGLRSSEFAFIDFRDSPVGRQACIQGSTLAVWEVLLLLQSYKADASILAVELLLLHSLRFDLRRVPDRQLESQLCQQPFEPA